MNNLQEITSKSHQPLPKITIRVFPNPTTDQFQISGIEEDAMLTISDLNCRVLLKKQIVGDEYISISNLRNGVYIAKIASKTGIVERKLIKK